MKMLKTFYVTFGLKYRQEPHPTLAGADPDYWLEVEALNEVQARAIVLKVLGQAWSFIYYEQPDREHFPGGCMARLSWEGELR